ncbi:hypothetical protein RMSM_00551 [Rhodopirellula maiorica SM1]|uniref:Uncharacterized protein n=2 Tax=Novipirellula TaxID=2795426 RepID=M5RTJ7_9BACT|nr:hypothetical protein RMSM_00551 [Rhodopirellula maiorica SM1]
MDSVYLLSEINPLGVAQFDPVRQAAQWHGFSCKEDDLWLLCEPSAFAQAIRQIQYHANGKQQSLVIRDWSHLDCADQPFLPVYHPKSCP